MHFGLIVLHTLYKVCQFYLSIFFAFIYIFFNVLRCILDYFISSSLYNLVEVRRVELLTSCLQGRRSSQTELYPHSLLRISFVLLRQISVNFSSPYHRTASSKLPHLPCITRSCCVLKTISNKYTTIVFLDFAGFFLLCNSMYFFQYTEK